MIVERPWDTSEIEQFESPGTNPNNTPKPSLEKPPCEQPELARLGNKVDRPEVRCVEYRGLDVRATLLLQRVLDLAGQFEPARTLTEQNFREPHVHVLLALCAVLR